MTRRRLARIVSTVLLGTFLACALVVSLQAQRGGGGGGADPPMRLELGRLDTLADRFAMSKEQKDKTKAIIDAAHKAAAPIRAGLESTRAAIGTAIAAGKPQAEIDEAVSAYAEQATAMTAHEMKTLAEVLRLLPVEQRQRGTAMQEAFFMFRGIFLDERRWNIFADGFYGY